MELLNKLKNSIKSSFKTVLLNFKEFVWIYIAVIIVQLLIGVWTLSAFTNHVANDAMFEENYPYDITITGPNYEITKLKNRFRNDINAKNSLITDFGSSGSAIGVSIKDDSYNEFYSEYIKALEPEVDHTITPKYVYHSEIQDEIATSSVLIGIVVFAVGVLILSVMYSVRTNHYKFQYGIYMTFGADKKMLGKIAMNELLAINTLALVPSAIVAYLLALTVYAGSGVNIIVSMPQVLIYVALSFIAVLIAACTSLGGLFFKPPIALITTADNSNFVSSPRRSFNIFAKKIPFHYEAISAWRFRKYIAGLVLGAVTFSVVFVTGIYCANMLKTENEASNEEFVLSYRHSTMVDDLRKKANYEAEEIIYALSSVSEIDKVVIEQSKSFNARLDHLLLQPGTEAVGSGFTVPSLEEADGYNRATNNCRYVCIDSLALALYDSLYEIEYLDGYDADKLLSDDNMIVVSEGLYGARCFNFKPGDTVVVADMIRAAEDMPIESDPLKILRQRINNCEFKYTEYTIGAVIHDTDATDSIIVGMNSDEYYAVTGEKRAVSEIGIFVRSDLDLGEISDVRNEVKGIMSSYSSWSTKTTDSAVFSIVDKRINLPGLLYLLSILALLITPMIWIFSQIMFYKKREPEFRTLTYIGATLKEIMSIHAVSGGIIFVISFLANFILSRLLCYGIYRIFTAVLPRLGILGMNVSFDSFVPLSTILLYAGVSALCGLISSLIPFILYKKKLDKELQTVLNTKIDD